MNATERPLLVECYLADARVVGLSRDVAERRRLVDVLSTAKNTLELDSAQLTLGRSSQPRAFDSMTIQKRDVLVAIPRETEDQRRQRAIANTGVANLSSVRVRIGVYLAPLYVEGEAHIGRTMGRIVFEPAALGRFFAVTNAIVTFPDSSTVEAPVVLVNRDAITAVCQLPVAQWQQPLKQIA